MSEFHADKDVSKILYNLGASMIADDSSDLGWTTYRNRRLHHYHGRAAPHHQQPVHHWMAGTALCLIAQMMALAQTANDAKQVYEEIQSAMNEDSTSASESTDYTSRDAKY